VDDVEGLAQLLGCRVTSLPMTYLGLPLGVSYKAVSIWNGVIEKMERWLVGWKRVYLNRTTYYLSLFPILVGVANQLEKLQKDFFMGWHWK